METKHIGFRTYRVHLPGENAPVEVYRKDDVDSYLEDTPELGAEVVVPQGSGVPIPVPRLRLEVETGIFAPFVKLFSWLGLCKMKERVQAENPDMDVFYDYE